MSKIDQCFKQLKEEGRRAFMPFITAGDPDLEFTAAVTERLIASGATMCEIGIPYSDPIADGPVIQASYTRSLTHGIHTFDILDTLQPVATSSDVPLVTMVSYAIVYRIGPEKYVKKAIESGISGAIIPDLPYDESERMAKLCREHDFSLIQLITPTTPKDRALKIAERTTGFIYYVSVAGVTGERTQLPPELIENVSWLREQTPLPVCIGFGVSNTDHVKMLAPVADGLIVGSAIVRRMERAAEEDRAKVLDDIGSYVEEMVAAMPECE